MIKAKKDWDLLTDKQRQDSIKEIIDFFGRERGEEIGIIAAESLLDMFLETNAKLLYNRGLEDTKKYLRERLANVEIDIDIDLKK